METFSALLAICAGNTPVPGEFHAQRPVTPSFDVFFDLRLNKSLSKQSWGWWFETLSRPLWRHRNDVYAMQSCSCYARSLFSLILYRMTGLCKGSCKMFYASDMSIFNSILFSERPRKSSWLLSIFMRFFFTSSLYTTVWFRFTSFENKLALILIKVVLEKIDLE